MSGVDRILYSERPELWARSDEITDEVWPRVQPAR